MNSDLAATYASLILADEGLEITVCIQQQHRSVQRWRGVEASTETHHQQQQQK